jgi:cobalt/nickel transport system ATP-binding protein
MKPLEIENLHFAYPATRRDEAAHDVLTGISFSIGESESVGLVGANGAGKSTLLKLICGLLEPVKGSIHVSGTEVRKDTLAQIRRELGYVFQDADNQLFTSTVRDDVAFAPRNYGYSREETEEAVDRALRAVRLEGLEDRPIYRLSGGEKKLASIATVLSVQNRLLLLDEPSIALDPRNRRNLIDVINSLSCAKLIASHDLDFIYDTCPKTILLSEGRIACMGETRDILRDRSLLEAGGLELPLSFSRA